jgi:hypothetical protein
MLSVGDESEQICAQLYAEDAFDLPTGPKNHTKSHLIAAEKLARLRTTVTRRKRSKLTVFEVHDLCLSIQLAETAAAWH